MSPVHLRNLGFPWNQPEDRQQLFRARRPGAGHLGRNSGCSTNSSKIYCNIAWTTRGSTLLDTGKNWEHASRRYGSKRYPSKILCTFKEKKSVKGQEKEFFQQKAERVRPNDTEAVRLGERNTKEPEVVVNTSNRIQSPATRNITLTQMERSVFKPESNIKSNALWLQISQFADKTQERFAKLKENNVMLEESTGSQHKVVKTVEEGYDELRKTLEETNKRLNQLSEEKIHCKREREYLDMKINKLFNFCQNINPKPQGNILDNPYHQEDCNNHPSGVRVFIHTPTQTPQISKSSICISMQFQQSSF
ncbi:hypothetical protein O181_065813 [Austropuccinia psidii MF-1]|uniref:Uncharacterized protein n=1 Tax=Austropuccinia psidii MF-1 TaxID=1389203 RepID=A0A9Q3EQA5_9BASI|nr:hypothetical protein [Austropuccinia psidii MF-1]